MKKLNSIFSLVLAMSFSVSSMLFAQTTEKKPMSPQAKGAIIGGATGAVGGAIINKKNRAVGAAVGGVVGAGVGFGVGKVIDNKQKKKAAEEAARQEELNQIAAANAANNSSANTGTARSYASSKSRVTSHKASARRVVAPAAVAAQPAFTQNGWIPNNENADPTLAYSNSEYKRKSW